MSELMFLNRICEALIRYAEFGDRKALKREIELIHDEIEEKLRGEYRNGKGRGRSNPTDY